MSSYSWANTKESIIRLTEVPIFITVSFCLPERCTSHRLFKITNLQLFQGEVHYKNFTSQIQLTGSWTLFYRKENYSNKSKRLWGSINVQNKNWKISCLVQVLFQLHQYQVHMEMFCNTQEHWNMPCNFWCYTFASHQKAAENPSSLWFSK